MAVSLEIFLHLEFGERYWPLIIASVGLFYGYFELGKRFGGVVSSGGRIFLWALLILGASHLLAMAVRWIRGGEVHSHSPGTPWFAWEKLNLPLPPVMRYLEPILAFTVGVFVADRDALLGHWLKGASITLLIKGQFVRYVMRSRILDSIDSRIEGKQLHEAAEHRSHPEKNGGGFSEVRASEDQWRPETPSHELAGDFENLPHKQEDRI